MAGLKKEGMVRFTRARTHVHMCMYTIQRYWYDMIHYISKLRIFPIWRIWVHIIVTCTEDTAIHRVCAVYANSYIEQDEQNIWQPSRMALNSNTAVQQSWDTKCCTNSHALLFVRTACCSFCCARAAYVVTTCRIRLVLYSQKNAASFLLVPHVQQ